MMGLADAIDLSSQPSLAPLVLAKKLARQARNAETQAGRPLFRQTSRANSSHLSGELSNGKKQVDKQERGKSARNSGPGEAFLHGHT